MMEDNASGSEIVVADIDGLGRCVVLICQDCEMPVAAPELFTAYQPDWVFTPIYDCSIDKGRWIHARAFGLSALSQARCVAVTHMGFAPAGGAMGIAVGPKETASGHLDEVDRAVALVKISTATSSCAASVQWGATGWEQSWLYTKPL
jgi:hypothetical protein